MWLFAVAEAICLGVAHLSRAYGGMREEWRSVMHCGFVHGY